MSDDHSFATRVIRGVPEPRSATSGPSRDEVRLHELRSLFETFLPDWKEEELAAVADIQDDFQTQQVRLESLFERGTLAPDEYASAVNAKMSLFLQNSAAILGEARAKQLFGVDDIGHVVIVHPERMRVSEAPQVASRLDDSNYTLSRREASPRFEALFTRYYARVWRYYRNCRVADDEAHDLAQDAFKRVFEGMGQMRSENEWRFLQVIAHSVFLNWLRDDNTQMRGSGKVVSIDDPAMTGKTPVVEQPDHATNEQSALRKKLLREAIAELPDGQRSCLQLWLREPSYEEIAKTLQISPDAVKSRIRDAKKVLMKSFPDEQESA